MSTRAAFNSIAEEVEVDAQDKASSADFKGRHAGETGLSNNPMVTKASYVLVFEMLERLAYYGIAANAVVYVAHQLNMTNVHAATLVQIWFGVSYVTPLIGASVADAYWGRFWTITIFSLVYMLGLLGLTLSAALPSMTPEFGQSPSGGMLALFWMAMYLVALGAGSMESCVSSFGADQFNPNHPSERHLIPRFFNWLHFVMNVGSLVAGIVVVNIQTNVSWGVGIGIPLASFCIAFAAFLAGSRKYRRIPPGGSPFARIFRVLGGACVHRKAQVPQDDLALFEVEGWESVVPGQPKLDRTASFRWLEKAAVETKPGQTDKWLVTLTEVEEVKCVARLLPIFATLIVYNAVTGQMDTLFILQGEAMDTSLGGLTLAAATVSVVESISSLFWVAAYDLVIAPFFASKGRPISSLQRIGAGYVTAILAMVAAAIVEICRLNVVHSHDLTNTKPAVVTVPISVWWQVPQYFLIGMSESLAMVGSQELFYSQAPIAMRSTCSALQLLPVALGCYLAAGLMGIVQGASGGTWIADNLNQAHMDYFFWLLAGLQAAALVLYVIIAKRFRYRTIEDTGADFEALALVPATRAGLQFSPSMTRNLSRSIGAGITSAASITTAHSCGVSMRRRSRRSVELSCSQKAEHQVHCDLS